MKKIQQLIIPTIIIIFAIASCKKPTFRESLSENTWKGNLYRKDENNPTILSPVIFKLKGDTAFIYANAIFGADNDSLKIDEFSDKDSILTLSSDKNQLKVRPYLIKEKPNDIVVVGGDFYMYLEKIDKLAVVDMSFYKNEEVSPYAYMYLEGTYEGEIEMENQLQNMFMSQLSVKMKMKFLDDSNVKIYTSALFGNDVKTHKYYVKNESIFIDNGNKNVEYEVKNHGNTIVHQDDKINLVLTKKY